MKEVVLRPQTLIMMIAPHNAGKTTLANIIRNQFNELEPEAKVVHVSSDNIRGFYLGDENFNKLDMKGQPINSLVFETYYHLIENVMRFPNNAEIVIADATNLRQEDIEKLKNIADKYNYNVHAFIFSYKKLDDYIEFSQEGEYRKDIIIKHMQKLGKLYKGLKKTLPNITYIKSKKDIAEIKIKLHEDWNKYRLCVLNKSVALTIIGDIHGHLDTLRQAIKEFKDNVYYVFVGDYIDKCSDYKYYAEIIDYLWEIKDKPNIRLLAGNHERFAYHYIKGDVSYRQTHKSVIDLYLDSVYFFQNNQEYWEKFKYLYENYMIPFFKTLDVVVNHAPTKKDNACLFYSNKPIIGDIVLRDDLNERVKKFTALVEELQYNEPYIVCGHISFTQACVIGKRVFLCSGADKGNKLSIFHYFPHENRYKLVGFDVNKEICKPELLDKDILNYKSLILSNLEKPITIKLEDLKPEDLRRLRYIVHNKIQFISGTMPPSKAVVDD